MTTESQPKIGWDAVLRLPGWQVFAVLQATIVAVFLVMWRSLSVDPLGSSVLLLSLALAELVYFGWLFLVGAAMNSRLPQDLRRGWIFPLCGLVVAIGYLLFMSQYLRHEALSSAFGGPVIALHLFAMFVNFYLLWYASRGLVAAEQRSPPPLDRVLGVFFVLWFTMFLPIGAWWVQARARKVAI